MKVSLRIIIPLLLVIAIIVSIGWYLFQYDKDFTRDFLVSQARALDRDGHHNAAAKLYALAYRQSENDEDVAIELAEQYKANGNFTKAEVTLSNAIANGGSAKLYMALCKTYVQQDKLLDAVTMLNNIADPAVKARLDALRPTAPASSAEPGYYNQYITVSLNAPVGTVYATTDGRYPSTEDTPYTEPITLPGGETTVYAVAVDDSGLVSPLTILGYTIGGVVEGVVLTDPAIDNTVREILGLSKDHTLYTDELWAITAMEIPSNAATLTDLSLIPFIKELTIHDANVDSLGSLSSLAELESLTVTNTIISDDDLQVIASLPRLTSLTLSGCSLSDISALSALTNLTYLDLSNNTVRYLSPLSGMNNLETLKVSQNAVAKLDALVGLTKLSTLDVSYNAITSVAPLSGCTALTTLNITRNSIADLTGLDKLSELTSLYAPYNALTDVSALQTATSLTLLDISNNALTDITMLSSLVNLMTFNFASNQVTQLPAFPADCALITIDGSKNQLVSLEALGGLERLNNVVMDYNESLSSADALTRCYNLVQLSVFGTAITDVSALKEMGVIVKYTPI